MLEAAIEAGADDCESYEEGHEIICAAGRARRGAGDSSRRASARPSRRSLTWKPQAMVPVDDERAEALFKLLEALDDNDDVQRVIANFEVSEATLARLAG